MLVNCVLLKGYCCFKVNNNLTELNKSVPLIVALSFVFLFFSNSKMGRPETLISNIMMVKSVEEFPRLLDGVKIAEIEQKGNMSV